MKPKFLLPVAVLLLILAIVGGLLLLRVGSGSRVSKETPFKESRQIVSEIGRLPPIRALGMQLNGTDWDPYVSLARRLRVTESNVIASALEQLSPSRGQNSFDISIRVTLLLRVCFECPSGTQLPITHGGWVSYSAQEAGRTNLDANWPVERKSSRFVLRDSLNGYLGRPYEAAAEFQWRLANCKWRDL